MFKISILTALVMASVASVNAQDKPDFSVTNLPDKWEDGQRGTNQCKQWGASSQSSMCQNVFLNTVTDFCVWGPYKQGGVGSQEEEMVSYCVKSGYGTRLIPDGSLKGAHFIKTPNFVQVTGQGDFTSLMISAGDEGGELDPHGATGAGNPPGGLVFSRNVKGQEGKWVQLKEWSNFMSASEFSFRACFPGDDATSWCPHTLDEMGSQFNHPGKYDAGSFDNCDAASGHYPAVFHGSTFSQGQGNTPKAGHKPGASSNCHPHSTVKNSAAKQTPYRRAAPSRAEE